MSQTLTETPRRRRGPPGVGRSAPAFSQGGTKGRRLPGRRRSGDLDLITHRGFTLLGQADVGRLRHLVNPKLSICAPRARHLFAGSGPTAITRAAEINRLLVREAKAAMRRPAQGRGPLYFGRGAEEAGSAPEWPKLSFESFPCHRWRSARQPMRDPADAPGPGVAGDVRPRHTKGGNSKRPTAAPRNAVGIHGNQVAANHRRKQSAWAGIRARRRRRSSGRRRQAEDRSRHDAEIATLGFEDQTPPRV